MNLTTVRILWSSLFVSTLGELFVVVWGDFDRHVDLQLPVTVVLAAVALSVVAASFLLPSRLYASALQQLALRVTEVPVEGSAERDYRSAAGSQRVFRDPEDAKSKMLRAFQPPFLVSLALGESIALIGLVLAQGRFAPSFYALPFFAVAWLLFALRFPTVASIVTPAERVYGARLPS